MRDRLVAYHGPLVQAAWITWPLDLLEHDEERDGRWGLPLPPSLDRYYQTVFVAAETDAHSLPPRGSASMMTADAAILVDQGNFPVAPDRRGRHILLAPALTNTKASSSADRRAVDDLTGGLTWTGHLLTRHSGHEPRANGHALTQWLVALQFPPPEVALPPLRRFTWTAQDPGAEALPSDESGQPVAQIVEDVARSSLLLVDGLIQEATEREVRRGEPAHKLGRPQSPDSKQQRVAKFLATTDRLRTEGEIALALSRLKPPIVMGNLNATLAWALGEFPQKIGRRKDIDGIALWGPLALVKAREQ